MSCHKTLFNNFGIDTKTSSSSVSHSKYCPDQCSNPTKILHLLSKNCRRSARTNEVGQKTQFQEEQFSLRCCGVCKSRCGVKSRIIYASDCRAKKFLERDIQQRKSSCCSCWTPPPSGPGTPPPPPPRPLPPCEEALMIQLKSVCVSTSLPRLDLIRHDEVDWKAENCGQAHFEAKF